MSSSNDDADVSLARRIADAIAAGDPHEAIRLTRDLERALTTTPDPPANAAPSFTAQPADVPTTCTQTPTRPPGARQVIAGGLTTTAIVAAGLIGGLVGGCSTGRPASAASNPATFVCAPSAAQGLQVEDSHDNPIFTVNCYGGAWVTGDKFSLTPGAPAGSHNIPPPGVQVFSGSPASYRAINPTWPGYKCDPGQAWYGQKGIYICSARRKWREISFATLLPKI